MSKPYGSPIILLFFLLDSTQKLPLTFENWNVVFPSQCGQLRVAGKHETLCQESCVSVWVRERERERKEREGEREKEREKERERERTWQLQTHLRKWIWNHGCFISFVITDVRRTYICAVCKEQYANDEVVLIYTLWMKWKLILK